MSTSTTNSEARTATMDEQTKDTGAKFSWTMWIGAAALLGLGASLPFADKISWNLVRVGKGLDALGVTPGVLFFAGLTFVSLALVVHAIRSTARETTQSTERMAFLSDELMTQMALVRSGQNASHSMQEELRQGLARVGAEVAGIANKDGDSSADALFRMAASVDQLNARMDDRFDTMTTSVDSRLGSVERELGSPSAEPSMNSGPIAAPLPVQVTPTAAPATASSAFDTEQDQITISEEAANPFHAVDLEQQPAMEFLDLMEETVEGRPTKESTISLDTGDMSVETGFEMEDLSGLDDISFPDDDFGSRRSA